MVIGVVLFWALVIVGIIALIRYSTGAVQPRVISPYPPYSGSPEQLLAARFARGEIEEPEYQQRLAVLRSAARRYRIRVWPVPRGRVQNGRVQTGLTASVRRLTAACHARRIVGAGNPRCSKYSKLTVCHLSRVTVRR